MFFFVPSALTSIVLGFVTANVFSKMCSVYDAGTHMNGTPTKDGDAPATHSAHAAAALYICAGLQILLLVVLTLRGLVPQLTDFFKTTSAQIVVTAHALTPNFIITSLWAARMMVAAIVDEGYVIDTINARDPYVKASYPLLTALMVFSNLYSAGTLAIIYANTGKFIYGSNKDELYD